MRDAIGSGFDTKTITLTVRQAHDRRDGAAVVLDPDAAQPEEPGDVLPGGVSGAVAMVGQEPRTVTTRTRKLVWKPVCYRVRLRPDPGAAAAVASTASGSRPNEPNPEKAVAELVSFLPVLAYDGSYMTQIDAGGILDIAMAGTSATLLARKWESAVLVNVDNDTLRKVLDNPEAMAAVERIEGFRALGDNVIETIIYKAEKIKETKKKAKGDEPHPEGEEGTHRGGEGVQVEAEAGPGEVDQVRDPHPRLHVPHRLPREHAAGRHHEVGAGPVPDGHRPHGRGLQPACSASTSSTAPT